MGKFIFTAAVAAALLTSVTAAEAKIAVFSPQQSADATARQPKRSLKNAYLPKTVDQNGVISPDGVQVAPYYQKINATGYLIGPNDEDWFYVIEPDAKVLVENEYFADYDFTGFKLKVYDENMNFVGQASGKIDHIEGSGKCDNISVGSQLTKSFFNANHSDYEVMVIGNFNPSQGYGAKQVTYVFSLRPEGEETPLLATIPGSYIVARNASTNVSENYWMAFSDDSTWPADSGKDSKFVIYRKSGYQGTAQKAGEIPFNPLLHASDGEADGVLPLALNVNGNIAYFATWHLEKPYFEDPDDPYNDNLTPDNKFVIELFEGRNGSNITPVKTTAVPMASPTGDFNMRTYSMGNFFGADDLTFDFGTGNLPAYIVQVRDSQIQGNQTNTYYSVYNVEGDVIKTFGLNNYGWSMMSNIPGKPEQICFDMESKNGENGLVFFDYPTMEEVGFMPKLFVHEDDIWQLGGVPDRLQTPNGVLYAAPVQPTGGIAAREQYVGYFQPDGTLDHIDHIQIEGNIAKINTYIDAAVLNPYMFNTNKETEYLHFIYRYKDDNVGTTLEMAVSDSKGNLLAVRKLPESGLTMPFCYVCNSSNDASLSLTYSYVPEGSKRVSVSEFIKLPLNKFQGGDGTVENPYVISTYGDLDQVRNNLTSHFALANSFDCEGRPFRQIEGNFLGSIDGRGNEITGLLLPASATGASMFGLIGGNRIAEDDASADLAPLATIKNLTLYKPVISAEASTRMRKFGFLASEARNALIENVHVIEPSFDAPENMSATAGLLLHSAFDSKITGSSVKDADVNLPGSIGLGGLAYIVCGGSVESSSFNGNLTAAQNVGGIAVQNRSARALFDNCHVDAALVADHTVGGILATSSRSSIKRSLVEGSIAVTAPTTDYADDDVVLTYNVGGIVGKLEAASYEEPDADDFVAIDKCVVAIDQIALSDNEEHASAVGAHRVVGWTSADGGSVTEWVQGDTAEDMKPVVHPAAPEARLGQNYVVTNLAEIKTADPALTTEGTTFAETADQAWFTTLGYAFDGATSAEPWVFASERPELFHEATSSQALYFGETSIEGVEGDEINVPLVFRGIDPSGITFSSTDESGVEAVNFVEPGEVVVSLKKAGVYTLTATDGIRSTALKVTVNEYSGVDQIGADAVAAITFNGSEIKAEGCAIAVYNAQGQLVLTGDNAVSAAQLLPGVYVAKAVAADGAVSTLKFAAK